MRRPAVGLGLVFAGGITIGLMAQEASCATLVLLVSCLMLWLFALICVLRYRDRLANAIVFILAGLMGCLVVCLPRQASLLDNIWDGSARSFRDCTVIGTIDRGVGDTPGRRIANRTYFGMHVNTIVIKGNTNAVNDQVHVTLFGVPDPLPRLGENWLLNGNLYRHEWRGRVQWRFMGGLREAQRLGHRGWLLQDLLQQKRREASLVLSHGIERHDDVNGVIQALLLGYRSRLDPVIKRTFAATGAMHIFAISGLHVAILCSILVFAVSLCGLPRTAWFFLLAPIVLLYAMATGSRASAVRAGVMVSAYFLAPVLHRRSDGVSALALAGLMILAWQPKQLAEIGFIFSFVAVTGILMLVPAFDRYVLKWSAPDPFIPSETKAHAKVGRGGLIWGMRLAAVSLAAWLSTMPLSVYFFGRFSPIALLANLLVIPLAFLIILTGCLSLVTGCLLGGWFAGVFNSANAVFVLLLVHGMRLLEAVPWGYVEDLSVSRWVIFGWYALLVYVALWLRCEDRSRDS